MAGLVFGSAEALAALEKDRKALRVSDVLEAVDGDEWSDYEDLRGRIRHLEDQLAEAEDDLEQIEANWKAKGLSVDEVRKVKDGK